MLNLGLIGFAQPWMLAALLTLPALWLILRLLPPAPRRISFPPIEILRLVPVNEETPNRIPWWLLLLRILIVTAVIVALAQPIWNPTRALDGSGPVLIVVDNGWDSARDWPRHQDLLVSVIERAEREGRPVALVPTATVREVGFNSAAEAADIAAALEPRPWLPDRASTTEAVRTLLATRTDEEPLTSIWIGSAVAIDETDEDQAFDLATLLGEAGAFRVLDASGGGHHLLGRPSREGDQISLDVHRSSTGRVENAVVLALGEAGSVVGRESVTFSPDEERVTASMEMPPTAWTELRRFELEGSLSVAGVALADQRWRRSEAGLLGAPEEPDPQPLLSEYYYVERALAGQARVHRGSIDELVELNLPTLIWVDAHRMSEADTTRVADWVEAGGVLVRFAGPNLAAAPNDPLVPVPLRGGGRQLDGALTWSEPLALDRMAPESVLSGLAIAEDVRIRRQVLAQPSADLADKTLAWLTDGTPLITADRRSDGWLVLFHTTANNQWSNLPLSGMFVGMIGRLLELAEGEGQAVSGPVTPVATLNAAGRLVDPPDGVEAVDAAVLDETRVSSIHPPGLYADAEDQGARWALNLAPPEAELRALTPTVLGTAVERLEQVTERAMAPWLLLLALILFLLDMVVSLVMRGNLASLARLRPAAGLAFLLLIPSLGAAQEGDDARVLELSTETRLAYMMTGDRELDRLSEAGLVGLSDVLTQRTSVVTGDPVALNLDRDPLELFPLIYWPVGENVIRLSDEQSRRISEYLSQGGMILFDTRDAHLAVPGGAGGPGMQRLQDLLGGLSVPPLEVVQGDHALTRAFYLLQEFPGRFAGQPLWVDRANPGVNDGVSSIVIGANDWVGAWARDEFNNPILPVVPGGERQREMARRVGVNLVMYALTGNYKTDQVHVPTLLERLGQ
ncbi:MAG: DUF4159 domain-containing protein [Geminicoccaceae bacterium]